MMDLPAKQATHQLQDPHSERKEFARDLKKKPFYATRMWSRGYAATFRMRKRLQNHEGTST
jgi:hypothetical protein